MKEALLKENSKYFQKHTENIKAEQEKWKSVRNKLQADIKSNLEKQRTITWVGNFLYPVVIAVVLFGFLLNTFFEWFMGLNWGWWVAAASVLLVLITWVVTTWWKWYKDK